jgi:hypothetical protein
MLGLKFGLAIQKQTVLGHQEEPLSCVLDCTIENKYNDFIKLPAYGTLEPL